MTEANAALDSRTLGTQQPRYAAFLSYSHADEQLARWIHGKLESFRIPGDLSVGRNGRRLGSVFRDRVELSASPDLGGEIKRALEDSDALIVVCSPSAARSQYVSAEVAHFKKIGRAHRIYAIVVAGEPNASNKDGHDAESECFPPALRLQINADGTVSSRPESLEPIAADLRDGKDGREGGLLKIISGLLGVPFDRLVQRQRRRERRLLAGLSAAAAAFLGLAIAAGLGFVLAESNARLASANALRAEASAASATQEANRAQAAIRRALAGRAWEKLKEGNAIDAIRYALIGGQFSQSPGEDFRIVLAAALASSGAARPPLLHDDSIQEARLAFKAGRLASMVWGSNAALLWDLSSGRLVKRLEGHTDWIVDIEMDPAGSIIATASKDGTVKLWDTSTGGLLRTLSAHGGGARSVNFSRDGQWLVTTGWDSGSNAKVWNTHTGALRQTLNGLGGGLGPRATFSADGKLVVTTAGNDFAGVWRVEDGLLLGQVGNGDSPISIAALNSAQPTLLTINESGAARLWNIETGEVIGDIGNATGRIVHAEFSPDGTAVLTAHADGQTRLWSAADGAFLRQFSGAGFMFHQPNRFSPDGKRLLTLGQDYSITVWNVANGQAIETLRGHTDAVNWAEFAADGVNIVSGSDDKTVRIWSSRPSELFRFEQLAAASAHVDFSPKDDAILITEIWNGPLVRTLGHDTSTARFSLFSRDMILNDLGSVQNSSAEFSADGRRIVSAGDNSGSSAASVWDAANGALLATFAKGLDGIMHASFCSTGANVVTAGRDKAVRVWDATSGALVKALGQHEDIVTSARFSPSCDRVISGSSDKTAKVFDSTTGKELLHLKGHQGTVRFAAYSPDGSKIVTTSSDKTAAIWDATTGQLLLSLRGHSEGVQVASFHSGGDYVATGGDDNTVRIWSVRDGRPVQIFSNFRNAVIAVRFSSDGRRLFAATQGETQVRAFDVAFLSEPWSDLKERACGTVLEGGSRTIDSATYRADPLLEAVWVEDSDVCGSRRELRTAE